MSRVNGVPIIQIKIGETAHLFLHLTGFAFYIKIHYQLIFHTLKKVVAYGNSGWDRRGWIWANHRAACNDRGGVRCAG
jgi:hypothetical protein